MPVDNELYDHMGPSWWDDNSMHGLLRYGMNPVRFAYMREVITQQGIHVTGASMLDIGCGGGLLAEEFAHLGARVTGIDPAQSGIEAAREHANLSGLTITYICGRGEALPFEDASFDIVYCCDVLEHVDSVPDVLAESARVLAPGGLFLFDTINRTLISRLLVITLMQDWAPTAFAPKGLHDWRQFIKPRELKAALEAVSLSCMDLRGLTPINPLTAVMAMRARAAGKITYQQMGTAVRFGLTSRKATSYIGYAQKPGKL